MLLQEREWLIGGLRQVAPDFARVQNVRPVLPRETTGLQPLVRETVKSASVVTSKAANWVSQKATSCRSPEACVLLPTRSCGL